MKRYFRYIKTLFITLLFLLLFFSYLIINKPVEAITPTPTPSLQQTCLNAGGEWELFSDSCADNCSQRRGYCLDVETWACSCRDGCWNGSTCESTGGRLVPPIAAPRRPTATPVPPAATATPVPPTATPNYPTWNVTVVPVCPSGMVQSQPLRMFRIIWPQMNQGPFDFDCVNDDSSTSNHLKIITPKNVNNIQGIYVGLENPIRDGENANCSEGVSIEPSSITPAVTVIRQGNNPPTGDFVNFAHYMNPSNWMVRWDWNRLTGGNYTINFNLPVSMCEAVSTATPIPPTSTPVPGCLCNANGTCETVCTFDKFSDITYISPVKCSLSSSLFATAPTDANKDSWCQATKRTKGDADGNGVINMTDYFYYVAAVNSGKIPVTVNPDFDGNGVVGNLDRTIIIKSLNP